MGDADEAHAAKVLKNAFGHTNLYVILELDGDKSSISQTQIKKAYLKQALKHHPDKGGDKNVFQALSTAYAILSDAEKRKIYDETGSLDDDEDKLSGDFDFWYNYFRNLFPKVTVQDIERVGNTYIGSEEETNDVIAAYEKYQGDLKIIMQTIMFAEAGSEERICNIINQAITDKKLKALPKYRKSLSALKSQSAKRSKQDEEDEGEELRSEEDVEDEEEQEPSNKKRKNAKAQPKPKSGSSKRKKKNTSEESDLVELIRQRGATQSASMLANIMKKYGGDDVKSSEYDIPDDEFEAIQRKIHKKK